MRYAMQAFNPYLPSYEYVPDGEPYVFGDRLYVYGSHDAFNGKKFCQNDYVCWSAPTNDLGDWRYDGVIYQKSQDPLNPKGKKCLYAPDIQQGPDGRYYLYYAFDMLGIMSVAVCDTPNGTFEFYGHVKYASGEPVGRAMSHDIFQFDPGVLVDSDGRIFLYSGLSFPDTPLTLFIFKGRKQEGCYCMELEQDMLTIKSGPTLVIPKAGRAAGTSFEGHEFLEASSIRKIGEIYYLIYSSINGHELCYATSDNPDGGFRYGGTLVSNGDIFLDGRTKKESVNYTGNNHGSIVEVNGQWYVFYHRQTNKHMCSRQGCAEPITIGGNGNIKQVEMTSSGLNGGPLHGKGKYEARIACNLYSSEGTVTYAIIKRKLRKHPCFTQEGDDRESDGNQYIRNMRNGSVAGYKYFDMQNVTAIAVNVRGPANGRVRIKSAPDGITRAEIDIEPSPIYVWREAAAIIPNGKTALYFEYSGSGRLDFKDFELK